MEDFQKCFTKLEVCHLGHGSLEADMAVRGKKRLEETLFTGEWTKNVSAGGCANYKGEFAVLTKHAYSRPLFPKLHFILI